MLRLRWRLLWWLLLLLLLTLLLLLLVRRICNRNLFPIWQDLYDIRQWIFIVVARQLC